MDYTFGFWVFKESKQTNELFLWLLSVQRESANRWTLSLAPGCSKRVSRQVNSFFGFWVFKDSQQTDELSLWLLVVRRESADRWTLSLASECSRRVGSTDELFLWRLSVQRESADRWTLSLACGRSIRVRKQIQTLSLASECSTVKESRENGQKMQENGCWCSLFLWITQYLLPRWLGYCKLLCFLINVLVCQCNTYSSRGYFILQYHFSSLCLLISPFSSHCMNRLQLILAPVINHNCTFRCSCFLFPYIMLYF